MGRIVLANALLLAFINRRCLADNFPLAPFMACSLDDGILLLDLGLSVLVRKVFSARVLATIADPVLGVALLSAGRICCRYFSQNMLMSQNGDRTCLSVTAVALAGAGLDSLFSLGSLFGHLPLAPVMACSLDDGILLLDRVLAVLICKVLSAGILASVADPVFDITVLGTSLCHCRNFRQDMLVFQYGDRTGLSMTAVTLAGAGLDSLFSLCSFFGHLPLAPIMSESRDISESIRL